MRPFKVAVAALLLSCGATAANNALISVRVGDLTITSADGTLTARNRQGLERWRLSLFEGGANNLVAVNGNVYATTPGAGTSAAIPPPRLLSVRLSDGRLNWKVTLPAFQFPKMLALEDNVVKVRMGFYGAHTGDQLLAFDSRSGRKTWTTPVYVGQFLARSPDKLLYREIGSGVPWLMPEQFGVVVIDTRTNVTRELNFNIQSRPRCGKLQDYADLSDDRADARHLYAIRRDDCGPFVARFDWQGGDDQKPLVYPYKKP